MAGPEKRTVRSLAEMPRSLDPPRDLWPQIEAQLGAAGASAPGRRGAPLRWLAAAAMVGALAVGVWIGRDLMPLAGTATEVAQHPPANAAGANPGGAAVNAAFVSDPRYARQRAELMGSLQAQLNAMPAPARAKVAASLSAIEAAKKDLESALGKDPSNALLQELLINTYQDEMRVLTDVHEAGNAGRGI